MNLTPASDDDLVGDLSKSAAESRHHSAQHKTAAGLAELSCVDGLCSLIAAVTARSVARPSVGLDNLAEKLTELLEAAKYADLK